MANQINLVPQILDLMLYSGDGFSVKFSCKTMAGTPIDLTGSVTAQIRLDRTSDDPPVATFAVNLTDRVLGIFTLSLTGDQTESLMDDPSVKGGKFTGSWDVEWDPASAEPRTLVQGKLECVSDVTR